ncbi:MULTISPECIES: phosphatidate cytidylyltransferase [unclassified Methylophaga]|jgi:phosphatidate cytidylyltransferase|uniref:phosphatidate cytidylyltransferase n=1 Tax=unclassified Methylophaga TaxID=2629249 RepID=UPI000C97520C|nr:MULTISPECIES: phosphatidate cytidylyltransferase [unclassified Methylophaga]MAK67042.1 phosphatidate cytidylyltransferase [Methylophaga sp.]MAY18079.1 phosphatidate cytidylyltransferase [Methylophaga sp.]HAO24212.1 phosphatidate cytidylyltransferase [Methylophaga sp.]HCD03991.1 phosphatidate cytidylyltransferase [Methylophaga sp.]|tara:strand:+ start:30985 stop:31809 length:825 start_codon:yes stop_codon:yes gene_type:complete
MLKQRLLAAAVLIPLVIMAILLLPSIGFIALLTVVALMAIWEWLSMAAIKPMFKVLASISFVAVLAVLLTTAAIDHILFSGLLFWILFSLLIVLFAHRPLPGILAGCFHNKVFTYLLSMLVTLLFVYSAVWLHGLAPNGPVLVLYVLISVWLADTGGYFAGKRWGKHALARAISPNKTLEGLAGALVLVALWSVLAYLLGISQNLSLSGWLAISLISGLISVSGDLFESLFKRSYQIKDSGQLIPGHGGMLDRMDSLLAAVPFFAALLWLTGQF